MHFLPYEELPCSKRIFLFLPIEDTETIGSFDLLDSFLFLTNSLKGLVFDFEFKTSNTFLEFFFVEKE